MAYYEKYTWIVYPGSLLLLTITMLMCAVIHQQRAVASLIATQTQLLMAVLRSSGVEVQPTHGG